MMSDGGVSFPYVLMAMRDLRRLLLVLAVLGCVLRVGAAWGQAGESNSRVQIAQDLFERGKLKWTERDFLTAASLFTASQEQVPKAGTSILLADCYEQLGRLRSARDAFQRAAGLASEAGDSDLARRARTREAALLPRIPRVEIRVGPPLPAGLLVMLNGVEVPHEWLNMAVPLDAGEYRLEARAPGHQAFVSSFKLVNDSAQSAGAQVAPVLLRPEGDSASSPASSFNQRQLAWWVGGGGAVLALTTGVLLSVSKYKYDQGGCGTLDANQPKLCANPDAANSAHSLANWAAASAVLSAVALGTAVTLYVTAEDDASGVTGAGFRYRAEF
jgi:hypothetical protein